MNPTKEEIEEAVKEIMDGEEDGLHTAGLILLASVHIGPNIDKIGKFMGIRREVARPIGKRFEVPYEFIIGSTAQ